jgi:hypothetical protein
VTLIAHLSGYSLLFTRCHHGFRLRARVRDAPSSCVPPLWLTLTASHLKYTIPPAVGLTWLYRPFFTKLDVYKVVYLILVGTRILANASRANRPGRCAVDHTMGLVPHSHRNLELPRPCHCWTQAAGYPSRRGLFLRRADIQHIDPLSSPQQAYLSARLPQP